MKYGIYDSIYGVDTLLTNSKSNLKRNKQNFDKFSRLDRDEKEKLTSIKNNNSREHS